MKMKVKVETKLNFRCTACRPWDGMGWDRLAGTGVATALKIVFVKKNKDFLRLNLYAIAQNIKITYYTFT